MAVDHAGHLTPKLVFGRIVDQVRAVPVGGELNLTRDQVSDLILKAGEQDHFNVVPGLVQALKEGSGKFFGRVLKVPKEA